MFKKMNHVHPIGKNEGLVEDLGAEVSIDIYRSNVQGNGIDPRYQAVTSRGLMTKIKTEFVRFPQ